MTTNIIEENKKIADELGIPRFVINAQQRIYYPYHLRHCTRYLEWVSIINVILIIVILGIFFMRPGCKYYLTSFDGKVTQINSQTIKHAENTTQEFKTQGNASS